tara:strand:- start:1826 stop:2194 length:369 start_codon:yes stop_codon:yes gene_type:complete
MEKIRIAGGFLTLLSVVFGAFCSHLLKKYLDQSALQSFEVGVRYMMYHGLALLIISVLPIEGKKWIFRFLLCGTILFSFSIFLLSLQTLFKVNLKWLGPITPIGGAFLIIGWIIFIVRAFKS